MNVTIHFLREAAQCEQLLRDDGWQLNVNRAKHPQVTDRTTACNRLSRLGLLTSSLVRIDFPPRMRDDR